MTVDEVVKIIEIIPEYIIYIYPGYLTVYLYCFLKGKTLKDNSYILIKSVAISYMYLTIIDSLRNIVWLKNLINCIFNNATYTLKLNICLIVLAILISYVFYRITLSKNVTTILEYFKINTTFYDNEIEVLADFNRGAWLCVYLNDDNVVYEGSLGPKEMENDRRKYICLNAFYKYFLDENGKPIEPYIEDNSESPNETVMIFYDSIKRIEKRVLKEQSNLNDEE